MNAGPSKISLSMPLNIFTISLVVLSSSGGGLAMATSKIEMACLSAIESGLEMFLLGSENGVLVFKVVKNN